jgi:lycopene cyclase domain-containing protein
MPEKYTYLILDLFTIAGPLLLSFDKKVAFYKSFKFLGISVGITSLLYILWDIWFTKAGIWKFNGQFLIGSYFFELPIEEYCFFLVVPYACLFIYRCLQAYLPTLTNKKWGNWANSLMMLFSAGVFMCNTHKLYTAVTFGLITVSLGLILLLYRNSFKKYSSHLFLAWVVAIIPMFIINGQLTGLPVLIYNNTENLGLRIGTIPFEDFFYNYLYMLWMIVAYEFFNSKFRNPSSSTL